MFSFLDSTPGGSVLMLIVDKKDSFRGPGAPLGSASFLNSRLWALVLFIEDTLRGPGV